MHATEITHHPVHFLAFAVYWQISSKGRMKVGYLSCDIYIDLQAWCCSASVAVPLSQAWCCSASVVPPSQAWCCSASVAVPTTKSSLVLQCKCCSTYHQVKLGAAVQVLQYLPPSQAWCCSASVAVPTTKSSLVLQCKCCSTYHQVKLGAAVQVLQYHQANRSLTQ